MGFKNPTMKDQMRIGLQIPNFTWSSGLSNLPSKLVEISIAAEEAGFYSLWVMDHFFQIDSIGPVDTEMLEGYCVLSYLASSTSTIKLGTLVTGGIYRYPGILTKTITTLDVLSGGRVYFGIGAGWYEREATGLGIPFPSLTIRFEQLEEIILIANQMWSDNNGPFVGEHYHLAETISSPQPISSPHPPILIGGMGEKKTLRLVAKYADACNLSTYQGMDILPHKLEILRQHCDDLGRPYDEIERTVLAPIHIAGNAMRVNDVIDLCRLLAQIGFQHVIFNMPNVDEISPLEIIGEKILPVVQGL
jgi:F420-dependent oxidoreductase-like protein